MEAAYRRNSLHATREQAVAAGGNRLGRQWLETLLA